MMKRFAIALLLAISALAPVTVANAAWPSDGSYTAWSNCFKITTQATKIDGVNDWYWLDLDDMPVEFHNAAQSDLDDFRATSDGETSINHRLIYYDAGTDTGLVAIAQPHGSSGASVDVDSYVYIGNAGASSTSTTSTFPATLECLYMLQEQPTSATAILDYTANVRHSTALAGSMTSGDLVTGGPHSGLRAVDFDANDRALFPSTLFDDAETANAFTWFGWVYPTYTATNTGIFGANSSPQLHVTHTDGSNIRGVARNSANTSSFTSESADGGFSENAWSFIAVVYDGSTLKTYRNGVEKSSVSATSLRSATLNYFIGHDNTTFSRSKLAEIGLYSAAMSANQILAMYGSATDASFWVIAEVVPDESAPWFQILLSEE